MVLLVSVFFVAPNGNVKRAHEIVLFQLIVPPWDVNISMSPGVNVCVRKDTLSTPTANGAQ